MFQLLTESFLGHRILAQSLRRLDAIPDESAVQDPDDAAQAIQAAERHGVQVRDDEQAAGLSNDTLIEIEGLVDNQVVFSSDWEAADVVPIEVR